MLAEGRLVNLAAAEGHPASVMDMSFSTQALAAEWMAKQNGSRNPACTRFPRRSNRGCEVKLVGNGSLIDSLTPEQQKYLQSWQEGT